jgi:hypothetical protein
MSKLKDINLEQLEGEVARPKAEAINRTLGDLNDNQLQYQLNKKSETEFAETYRELYPEDTGEFDFMYPKMKEERERTVKEVIRQRKGKVGSLSEEMYPSLHGSGE